MADYKLSNRAEKDLGDIAGFSIESFGIDKAREYRERLTDCFLMLANNPLAGRSAEHVNPRLRCFKHQSHVVYYMPVDQHIVIVRILHHSMDVLRHF